MNTYTSKVGLNSLFVHPYLQGIYEISQIDDLQVSLERTGNRPVNRIVVIPRAEGGFFVLSGMRRLQTMIKLNEEEIEVLVIENILDDAAIENLIVDLNKQRVKSGRELLNEFRHYLVLHEKPKGKKGRTYDLVGREINMTYHQVKDLVIIDNFFKGEGDLIMESVFGGRISLNQANKIKKVVEKYPERFGSQTCFERLCNRKFDFERLEYATQHLKLDDDSDFPIIESYLLRNKTLEEFDKILFNLDRINGIEKDHNNNKANAPDLPEEFDTKNTHLIKGDNRV
jgi:hypothetical protein